ncbi:MAG: LemA family protein [Erysipelotrichaceae bacterium]|jgi:LemA protein|nr:LemA family protein [Erysipelotrichaceae bacterium]
MSNPILAVSPGGIAAIVIGSILTLFIVVALITYAVSFNALNKAKLKVDSALSGIDVMLEKRYDLLTKSIEVVKAYAKYESTTIHETIKSRTNLNEIMKFDGQLTSDFKGLKVVAEAYPTLLSANNYLELQKQIADLEDNLAASKRLYNSNVTYLNELIVNFPTNLFARKYQKAEFYKIDDIKRRDVKIDL